MKKINLTPYEIEGLNEKGEPAKIPFNMRESLVNILFTEKLKLNPVRLLEQNKLAEKLMSSGDEILLEETDYKRLKEAMDVLEGLSKSHIEFVTRVFEAEEVEIAEKKG